MFLLMVPRARIELAIRPYQGRVIPFNYRGVAQKLLHHTKNFSELQEDFKHWENLIGL